MDSLSDPSDTKNYKFVTSVRESRLKRIQISFRRPSVFEIFLLPLNEARESRGCLKSKLARRQTWCTPART